MEKTTGFPEAPPVADSVICWPTCNDGAGLKPVMVCAIIADCVAEPLMFTVKVAAGVATLIAAEPVCAPLARPTVGAKVAVNSQDEPGAPVAPLAHPPVAAGTKVNNALEPSVTSGVAKVEAEVPELIR